MSEQDVLSMRDLCDLLFDHDARVDHAIHIQSMLALPTAELEESIEDGELDALDELLGFEAGTIHEAYKEEELGWVLRGVDGWIVGINVAMHGPWSEGKTRSCRSYPGMRTGRWFKGDTYEDALSQAVEWVESDPPQMLWDPK